ncbi:protein of unknown function DUF342 [Solidesulfovibrio fructosivorans JJ]]|uniref:DUF342 domain-containing protein n=1 Tax=Solidesulfovibrio fructosivorans JJ] TaxID=596151 RepID=E1JSK9_SOLFR|nr:FapA family protein [Solidesulfovibrio fructosivorans]EFL52492.1 protein of unknown function DUF342 [Solidesulfovibrio fructosivorans JJ]]
MPYRLKYYFDPDYEHRRLRPKWRDDGSVDQYDLGYVQNVVVAQALAEWEDISPDHTPLPGEVVADQPAFSHGEGCRVDPENPRRLIASVNGHVACADGKITVHDTLSIGHDIDFHTGNIVAIGDVLVGGSVRSGFLVMGRNITVRGAVEAARIQAMGNISCQSGIMGGSKASLRAGKSLRAKFCENAALHAAGNILIDGSSMHCRLFAGEKLAVKARLIGGEAYCGDAVYVGEQLGGTGQSQTRLLVGYDPERIHKDQRLKARMAEAHMEIEACRFEMQRGSERVEAYASELTRYERLLSVCKAQLWQLWSGPDALRRFADCRVIVPGRVGANVEINIGEAFLTVPEDTHDVVFRYQDGEIVMEHPALRK